jgi:hypothetical protein
MIVVVVVVVVVAAVAVIAAWNSLLVPALPQRSRFAVLNEYVPFRQLQLS